MFKNIIYLTILFLVVITFIVLPFISVPISSSSRGIVRSLQENTIITAVVSGKVILSRLEKNNQILQKGDTLLIITSKQLNTQKQLQTDQNNDYNTQLQDLNKITKGNFTNLQTEQYQKEVTTMQVKIAQVQSNLSLAKEELKRANSLYKKGVIAKAEFDKIYFRHKSLVKQKRVIKEQQVSQWQAKKRDIKRHVRNLNSEIERIQQEQENYIITAPISGRLVEFSGIKKGNFINQGQHLGLISPESPLIVECLVSPKDIGFIYNQQKVKLQLDTYNYNQWGLLDANVIDIDQNISVNKQTGQGFFRVRCKMNKNYLELKSGFKGQIGKGMTLTARFHLLDRTLWQLLFDKLDDWFNPKLKNEKKYTD